MAQPDSRPIMQRFAPDTVSMGKEPLVNGMWNAILERTYVQSTLNYIIAPEYAAGGLQTDLAVLRIAAPGPPVTYTPILIYEGKNSGGASPDTIYGQLQDFMEQLLPSMQADTCCWLIGAQGPRLKIWVMKRGNTGQLQDAHLYGLKNVNGNRANGILDSATNGTLFNLTNANDRTFIWNALWYMWNRPTNTFTFTAP